MATIPDSVTIVDDGGADYIRHDEAADVYRLTWIDTQVDKGIDSRPYGLGFDTENPMGQYEIVVRSRDGKTRSVEIDYTVSLQIGPLRGKTTSNTVNPEQKSLSEIDRIYDYEKWRNDPQSVHWMALGFATTETTVTAPPATDQPNEAPNDSKSSGSVIDDVIDAITDTISDFL